MKDEFIKCIYLYMQDLKIKINELGYDIDMFKNSIKQTNDSLVEIDTMLCIYYNAIKILKRKFIINNLLTLGTKYKANKYAYDMFMNTLYECIEDNIYLYENATKCLQIYEEQVKNKTCIIDEHKKNYKKLEMFMNFVDSEKIIKMSIILIFLIEAKINVWYTYYRSR